MPEWLSSLLAVAVADPTILPRRVWQVALAIVGGLIGLRLLAKRRASGNHAVGDTKILTDGPQPADDVRGQVTKEQEDSP